MKYLTVNTDGSLVEVSGIATSAGAADAGKAAQLDSNGKLDLSMMPTGIGADTLTIVASEALSAGDFVNIYNNSGTKNCRKALATDNTKPVHGFVLAAVAASGNALVYLRGLNTMIAVGSYTASDVGKTAFLSASVSGGITTSIPASSGNIVQNLGTIEAVGTYVTVNFSVDTKFIVRA